MRIELQDEMVINKQDGTLFTKKNHLRKQLEIKSIHQAKNQVEGLQ